MKILPPLLYLILFLSSFHLSAQSNELAKHARKAPASLSYKLPALTEYLTEPATNDREKAYVLFVWLENYLQYDNTAKILDRRINRSVGDILRRKKGICFDYAILYERLCYFSGLECKRVDGYAFTDLKRRSLPETPNHSWNAILIDSMWHLLDPTWGFIEDEWAHTYKKDYFLPPPELFILNHLPANPIWQLTNPCISKELFEKGATSISDALEEGDLKCLTDSLQWYLDLSKDEQVLAEAKMSYEQHPTNGNKRFYSHALIDYAVVLEKETDALAEIDSLEAFVELQQEAIRLCEKAASLSELQEWQISFYAGLLINLAVAESRISDVETAIEHLEKAQEVLQALPENDYYRQYAEEQCRQFLEVLRE